MYKKLFLTFLIILGFLPVFSVLGATYIFEDNLESCSVNSNIGSAGCGWSSSANISISTTTTAVYSGTKGATITGTTGSPFTYKSGTGTIDGTATIWGKTATAGKLSFVVKDGSQSCYTIYLYTTSASYRYYSGSNLEGTFQSGLTANTWYQLVIQWRDVDKYSRYKIEGVGDWSAWIFANTGTCPLPDAIYVGQGDATAGRMFYWDDVSYVPPPPDFAVYPTYPLYNSTTTDNDGLLTLSGSYLVATTTPVASSTMFNINIAPTDSAVGYYYNFKYPVVNFGLSNDYSQFVSLPNHSYYISYFLTYGSPFIIDDTGQIIPNYSYIYDYPDNAVLLGTTTLIISSSSVATTTIPLIPSGTGGMVFATGTPDYIQEAIIEYFNKFFFLKSVFPFSYMSYFASWVQTLNFTNVTEVPLTFNFAFASSTIIATTSITALTSQNVRIGTVTDTFSHWAYIVSNFTFFIGFLWAMWKFAQWVFESPPDPFSFGPVNPA